MLTGFEKIIEERIRKAQKDGEFDNLSGSGEPLTCEDDSCISEELRLAYKILKNADCLPPEIELKNEIKQTEDLLEDMEDTAERYRLLKKLNFLIMKMNTIRRGSIEFELPQKYEEKLVEWFESKKKKFKTEI